MRDEYCFSSEGAGDLDDEELDLEEELSDCELVDIYAQQVDTLGVLVKRLIAKVEHLERERHMCGMN